MKIEQYQDMEEAEVITTFIFYLCMCFLNPTGDMIYDVQGTLERALF